MARAHRGIGAAVAAGLAGLAAWLVTACSTSTPAPAGGIEIVIASDGLTAGTDFDDVRLEVSQEQGDGGWQTLWNKDYFVPQETTLPTTFAIVAGKNGTQEALVKVTALKGTEPVVLREAEVQVPENRVAELRLVLAERCEGQVTLSGSEPVSTCTTQNESCQPDTGSCGPNEVPVANLPTYVPGENLDATPAVDQSAPGGGPPGDGDAGSAPGSDATIATTRTDAGPGPGDDASTGEDATLGSDARAAGDAEAPRDANGPIEATTTMPEMDAGVDAGPVCTDGQIQCVAGSLPAALETCGSDGQWVVKSCQGGACSDNACQPLMLASNQNVPNDLAVDSNNLYWTNEGDAGANGSVMQVQLDGGNLITLATGRAQPVGLVVDSAWVYWAEEGTSANNFQDGVVAKVPIGGGTVQTIAQNQALPIDVAVSPTNIYWTNGGFALANDDAGTVMMAALDGGSATTLATGQHQTQWMAIDQTYVYWTTGGTQAKNYADGTIEKIALDGTGGAISVATGQTSPSGLAVDANNVYWPTLGTSANNFLDGTIVQQSKTGTRTTIARNQAEPLGVAVDANNVYWPDGMGTLGVFTAPIGGGATATFEPLTGTPSSVIVDGTSVYWDANDGTVMKLAK
jgi:hypothetical protein